MNYDPQKEVLIQQIAGLCYQVKCERGIDVFFSWSPRYAEIAYWENGGAECREILNAFDVYFDHPGSAETMKAMRDHLREMLDGSNEQDAMKGTPDAI